MNMIIAWSFIALIFVIIETVTTQLVSIWFVVGAIGALVGAFFNVSTSIQIVIFLGFSVAALLITRPLIKKWVKPKIQRTNADRNIGADALVTVTINNLDNKGQVKVNGKEWSAVSMSGNVIEEGEIVVVEKIEGVKLLVKEKRIVSVN